MCGFAGWLALNGAPPLPQSALELCGKALSRRGPDAEGFYEQPSFGIVHRRLAILDLSAEANQPMLCPEGRFVIAYNGEIFNFQELRKQLEGKGVIFRTRSDTEVLLHLWRREGPACLQRLNGFFAFAVWDNKKQELFLVRDRMGIKPLYYGVLKGYLYFASEPKGLLPLWERPELNSEALVPYFMLSYIPAPLSIYKDIYKLEQGHYLRSGPEGSLEKVSWWHPVEQDVQPFLDFHQAARILKKAVQEAVEDWLQADVPVGVFLSGGVDSAVITLAAAQHHKNLTAFSIGFRDEPFYDETDFARIVAQKAGLQHQIFSLTTDDLFKILPEVLDYLDEPFADSSALAVSILSREVRRHAVVALSGDGGDELFGGYQKHVAEAVITKFPFLGNLYFLLPWLKKLPQSRTSGFANRMRQAVRFLEAATLKPCERYLRWASFGDTSFLTSLLGPVFKESWEDFALNFCQSRSWQEGLASTLLKDLELVLANDMLVKTDRMSMMHSLEVRPPLLDNRVVDMALSFPDHFKAGPFYSKKILREAFRDELPPEILSRKKRGFEVPLRKWFLGSFRTTIEKEYTDPDFLKQQGIFNSSAISQLWKKLEEPQAGDSPWWLWSLIVFQHWYKKYLC